MATLFGEPRRPSELGRQVPKRVDLFEVTADLQLPKPLKLRAAVAAKPKLAFSVVVAESVFGPEGDAAVALASAAVEALRARYLVVRAPSSLRPGPASEKRVAEVLSRFSSAETRLVFEPSGLWQRHRVRALAAEAKALFSQRLDELEAADSLYVRLVQIGTGRALLGRKLDVFARVVKASADACIVVEGGGVAAVRTRLEAEIEFAAEPGAEEEGPFAFGPDDGDDNESEDGEDSEESDDSEDDHGLDDGSDDGDDTQEDDDGALEDEGDDEDHR